MNTPKIKVTFVGCATPLAVRAAFYDPHNDTFTIGVELPAKPISIAELDEMTMGRHGITYDMLHADEQAHIRGLVIAERQDNADAKSGSVGKERNPTQPDCMPPGYVSKELYQRKQDALKAAIDLLRVYDVTCEAFNEAFKATDSKATVPHSEANPDTMPDDNRLSLGCASPSGLSDKRP
jgi:hypothetical protein